MKILVPVDGSRYSLAAVGFIASRTTLIGAAPQVHLLNVQVPVPPRAARVVGRDILRSYYDDESAKALKPALAVLKKAGLTAAAERRVGQPGEQIAAAAEDGADLIVMGSHGHGALLTAVLGSVTHAVLARCKTPLLMLRARTVAKGDSLKVGIAVDGSRYGSAAVRYVLKHRHLLGAAPQLTLLHVVPDFAGAVMPDMAGIALPAFGADDIKAMQDKAFEAAVAPARRLLAKAGVAATEVCLAGNAGIELSAYAKKQKLDLLVLGSHGYGAFKRAVLGSVAHRVAAQCETPLLLIRQA
jgi:nucleotide-binding universal stress UspA family protein